MGQVLYAVAMKVAGGFTFRAPNPEDSTAIRQTEAEIAKSGSGWAADDLIATEELSPVSNYDRGHRLYGMFYWADFFAPRQKLSLVIAMECLKTIWAEMKDTTEVERAKAIQLYLALAFDKASIYNCITSRWHSGRLVSVPDTGGRRCTCARFAKLADLRHCGVHSVWEVRDNARSATFPACARFAL